MGLQLTDAPKHTASGKLILIAHLTAKPGKESRLKELLAACRDYAISEKEPRTLTYRVIRIFDEDGKPGRQFTIFEEYQDAAVGVLEHAEGQPLKDLFRLGESEGIVEKAEIRFFEEI